MRGIHARIDIVGAAVLMVLICAASVAQCQSTNTLTITLPGDVPLEMIRIPAGSFRMGSNDPGWSYSDEQPVHTVHIDYDFYMGKYEVTRAQWLALMNDWPDPVWWPNITVQYNDGDDDYIGRPTFHVSWNDTQNFIAALNIHLTNTGQGPATFRLPSESEWEYACRAGTQTRFYFGDSDCSTTSCAACELTDYAWWCGNTPPLGPNGIKKVGQKLPNAFGLFDMHGNVWEWCVDYWHESYDNTSRPDDGSPWLSPTSSSRVIRGGDWNTIPNACRSAHRNWPDPDSHYIFIGFRLARTQ